jgi:hypothetical protein
MCIIHDPIFPLAQIQRNSILSISPDKGMCVYKEDVLFNVKRQKRQVKQKRHPIPIDKEQESQKAMDRSFGDNVRIETVAKIDRVNVITIFPHHQ